MGSLRRKTSTRPLPTQAELFQRKGERHARWLDKSGKKRTAKVTTGRDGSDRLVIECGKWLAKYRDGSGIVREVSTGCKDKGAAQSMLSELERRAELVRAGVISPVEDAVANHRNVSLVQHFSDFETSLRARNVTGSHQATTLRYLNRLAAACHWERLRDLHRGRFEQWLSGQTANGTSARTRNGFHTALVSFANWCVTTGRL